MPMAEIIVISDLTGPPDIAWMPLWFHLQNPIVHTSKIVMQTCPPLSLLIARNLSSARKKETIPMILSRMIWWTGCDQRKIETTSKLESASLEWIKLL
jgi:hypothetical protein